MATIRWLLGLWPLLAITAVVPFAAFAYDGHAQINLVYSVAAITTE